MTRKKYLTLINIWSGLIAFIIISQCNMKNQSTWNAIIAFNNSESISEDWSWFYGDIKEACQGKHIYVVHAQKGATKVLIGTEKELIAMIDIAPYIKYGSGYLFISNGQNIRYQEYNTPDIVLKKAFDYFNIPIPSNSSIDNNQENNLIDENR